MSAGCPQRPETLYTLELDTSGCEPPAMWVLGIKLKSSAKVGSTLNH